jgi:iron complex transport system ATP-binding protein
MANHIAFESNMGPALTVEDLSVGFKSKQRGSPVLAGLNFALNPGELLVLAGPNGGGKTTLLKTLGGYLPPLSGKVRIGNRDLGELGKREKAVALSFLFQGQTALWPFSVEEFINQGRFPHRGIFASEEPADKDASARAIRAAGLSGYETRLVTELSGGEFQRVLIARAMTQEAPIILMDEPINNLDPKYQFIVMDLIRSLADSGLSILMSLHDLTLAAAYADRVALAAAGRLVALGRPEEVLREETLTAVFEIPPGYQKYIMPRA